MVERVCVAAGLTLDRADGCRQLHGFEMSKREIREDAASMEG